MDRDNIVLAIDAEISRLQQARALLAGTNAGKPKPRASASASLRNNKPVRTLSDAARAKISAAQKARWAKSKRAAKKEAVYRCSRGREENHPKRPCSQEGFGEEGRFGEKGTSAADEGSGYTRPVAF